jgi:uncharacterized protein YraI
MPPEKLSLVAFPAIKQWSRQSDVIGIEVYSRMRSKLYLLSTVLVVFPLLLSATEYYTTVATIHVRTGPGTEYPIQFTIKNSEQVELLARAGVWYKIKYAGKSGYAYAAYFEERKNEPKSVIVSLPVSANQSRKQSVPLKEIFIFVASLVLVFALWIGILNNKQFVSVTQGTPEVRHTSSAHFS